MKWIRYLRQCLAENSTIRPRKTRFLSAVWTGDEVPHSQVYLCVLVFERNTKTNVFFEDVQCRLLFPFFEVYQNEKNFRIEAQLLGKIHVASFAE